MGGEGSSTLNPRRLMEWCHCSPPWPTDRFVSEAENFEGKQIRKKGIQHHHDTRIQSSSLTRCGTPRQRIYFRMNTGGYIPARTATCIGRFRLKPQRSSEQHPCKVQTDWSAVAPAPQWMHPPLPGSSVRGATNSITSILQLVLLKQQQHQHIIATTSTSTSCPL